MAERGLRRNRPVSMGTWAVLVLVAGLLAGCGAKHTVGDTEVHDPGEESWTSENRDLDSADSNSGKSHPDSPEKDKAVGQFVEAGGTTDGGQDWVAGVHEEEGGELWLEVPFDATTTYAGVRAATLMQGLALEQEDFDDHRFLTERAYWARNSGDESGVGLFMRVLTSGFGKDSRYQFEVSVSEQESGGSRVDIRQHRQIIESTERQDVGDWVPSDEPDPEITRKYLEGLQRAFGE